MAEYVNRSEYDAAIDLAVAVGMFGEITDQLKKRLKTIPGGYRDARMLDAVSTNLLVKVVGTFPPKTYQRFARESKHIHPRVTIRPDITESDSKEMVWVNRYALEQVVSQLVSLTCTLCEKNKQEGRQCPLREQLAVLRSMELPDNENGECPLMGLVMMEE